MWMKEKAAGIFTLREIPEDRDLLMVATGTGLGPYISMVRTYYGTHHKRRFVVVHGARHSWDLGYRSDLEALSRDDPNIIYLPTVTRVDEERSWAGHCGRVQSVFEDGALEKQVGCPVSPENFDVLLCGNPEMIQDMRERLEVMGFKRHRKRDPGNLHFEKYW